MICLDLTETNTGYSCRKRLRVVYTFLYGWGLQHLLVVWVVQSTLGPKGNLPLHFLEAERGIWLYETSVLFNMENRDVGKTWQNHGDRDKAARTFIILNGNNKTRNSVCVCVCLGTSSQEVPSVLCMITAPTAVGG